MYGKIRSPRYIMKTKENAVLGLFFENPTKEWHFEDVLREAKITRSKATKWLKKFTKEGIIIKRKEKGRMPYYSGNYDSFAYKNRKKLFAITKLYNSGLLNHLSSLQNAKTVILFGSYARSDWYKNSDIDIFIYGDTEGLKIVDYEIKLHKEIQLFIYESKKDLSRLSNDLLKNIIKGNLIKGDIDFIKVNANA